MSIYFTSDSHYFHKKIIDYSSRPFSSVEEMNESLIEEYNKVVKPSDTCYHLGDFGFANATKLLQVISRLNGNKVLILGNHDKDIMNNPSNFIGSNYFSSIQHYKVIKHNGQKIILFHYACRVYESSHNGAWQLHGHSHGSLPPMGKTVDVGVDAKFITSEYRPISFDEVNEFMKNRTNEVVDHHE